MSSSELSPKLLVAAIRKQASADALLEALSRDLENRTLAATDELAELLLASPPIEIQTGANVATTYLRFGTAAFQKWIKRLPEPLQKPVASKVLDGLASHQFENQRSEKIRAFFASETFGIVLPLDKFEYLTSMVTSTGLSSTGSWNETESELSLRFVAPESLEEAQDSINGADTGNGV